jgi:phage baseplate assembly protein W
MALKGLSFPFRKEDGQFPKIDEDKEAVKSNIIALFNLPKGLRVHRPTLGSIFDLLIFESQGPLLEARIQRAVRDTIANGEPRADVQSVDITTSDTTITVDIVYVVQGQPESVTIEQTRG